MGSKASCQGRNCKEEPFGTCSCESLKFCTACYQIHLDQNPKKVHNFVLLKPELAQLDDQPITWKSIILTKLIYRSPEGSTEVHEGNLRNRLGKYAIKIMYCRGDGDLAKKQKESEMQANMKHKNICECIASFADSSEQSRSRFIIVMEFSENGDIEQEIEKRKLQRTPWPESELLTHIKELIDAFAYLQDHNLTHGDVKPRNLYLTSEGKIKIGDFGESKQSMQALVTQTYQVTGTVVYFSPLLFSAYLDIIKGKNLKGDVRHNPIKSDVYSLGLSLLHMASLTKPTELNNLEIGIDTLQQNVDKAISKLSYTDEMKNIFSRMLCVQENRRNDFKQLRSYLNPGTIKEINSNETLQHQTSKIMNSSRTIEAKLVSISQTQGKANMMDQNYKLITLNSHRIQSSSRLVAYKDSVIITGGLKNSKGVFIINVTTCAANKWAELNTGRSWHSIVYHNDNLVVMGGRADNKEPLKSTEIFSLSETSPNKEWRVAGCLAHERESASAISVGEHIYIFGGSHKIENRWVQMDSIERFTDNSWEELLNIRLHRPCSNVGLAINSEKNILIIGGTREKGAHSKEVYEFNCRSGDIILSEKSLDEADTFSSQSLNDNNGKIYILGNQFGSHIYDEREKKWELQVFTLK